MRTLIAVAVALAVQIAAVTAPFVHAHPDDHASAHHHGRVTHTHWAGHEHASHPFDTPVIRADDHDRAVFLNAFVAVSRSAASRLAPALETFALAVPATRLISARIDVVRSHDPPPQASTPSRAPPAFLS